MHLSALDWTLIVAYFGLTLAIGLSVSRRAGQSAAEFFLSSRNMPWWLLGISMVATTFSADTPNLVTDIVRQNGVAGNWVWWAFLLTGMLTVFVYARLWRRSGVLTDLEFYELRYSGKPAAFLRGFRAIYLGVFFNVMIMATVCLAAIKIGSAMLELQPWETIISISVITVLYSSLGGLRGVLLTDLVQFVLAMIGSIWAMWVVINLPEVESLSAILEHEAVKPRLSVVPDPEDRDAWLTLLLLPLAVQWWSVWYPGAEPGGGGYIAQRMLSARSESHAVGATFFFNVAHYALRPWPWLLIALASLVIYPMHISGERAGQIQMAESTPAFLAEKVGPQQITDLEEVLDLRLTLAQDSTSRAEYARLQQLVAQRSAQPEIRSLAYLTTALSDGSDNKAAWADPLATEKLVRLHLANPELPVSKLGQDLAYPTMLRFLPPGLIGLVLASLIAAVMSTLSTHLNWGASYVVSDVYQRFVRPQASEAQLVGIGRLATAGLMILAALFALLLSDALQSFQILLQIGAGTGLIFILRWFWWRINAWSEISAMLISFLVAIAMKIVLPALGVDLSSGTQLLLGVGITTVGWLLVTFLTPPDDEATLRNFYRHIQPAGRGWWAVLRRAQAEGDPIPLSRENGRLPSQILAMLLGTMAVYGALFATGYWIYGQVLPAAAFTVMGVGASLALLGVWQRIKE
jgi:solute:Na+ symporter, SSS family